jgi:hypothetical protein
MVNFEFGFNLVSLMGIFLMLLFIPTSLFVSGLILLYQGWRLDPILQFQQLLMIIISILLVRLYTK